MMNVQHGVLHLGAGVVRPISEFLVRGDFFRLVTPSRPHDVNWFVVSDEELNAYVLRATLVRPSDPPGQFEIAGEVMDRQAMNLRAD